MAFGRKASRRIERSTLARSRQRIVLSLLRFANAADQTDLQSAKGQAFDLVASLEVLGVNGQCVAETYRIDLVSKGKWRETIALPGYQRTRIGGEGKEWRVRSIDFELPQILQLDRAPERPKRLHDSATKVLAKARGEKSDSLA